MEKMILDVKAVIDNVRKNGNFGAIRRKPATPYDISNLLEVTAAVGAQRTPSFRLTGDTLYVYENILRWIMGDPAMEATDPATGKKVPGDLAKGIIICGPTGGGKSWAMEILSYMAGVLKAEFLAGNTAVPLRWPCWRAYDLCRAYSQYGEIDRFYAAPVLCVQDLGSEPSECLYMGNRADVLRQLLEYRGDCGGKLTLITSNLTYDEMQARYGDRVASRLYGMCNYFQIADKDRRRGS